MKNILIISDTYPPEVSSGANLIQQLATGLSTRGYNVTILTAHSRYYLSDDSKTRILPEYSIDNGIGVIRIKTLPLKKINFVLRGISQLTLPFIFFMKARRYLKDSPDVVIVYSPPITLAFAGIMVKRKYHSKLILNLQDIFPQNAIDLGILKNGLVIKFFEFLEKTAYKKADHITFHSDGGRRFLIENKHIAPNKITTLPNWIDVGPYLVKSKNDFRKIYNLENKFIFLFAGIIGPAQGTELLIDIANRVRDLKNAVFLLVGGGMKKNVIEKLVRNHNLDNVILKNFVSSSDYPDLVKSIDVGIVCLSPENKTPFIPGKFLGYMAASKPILAFLNKESDGFALIKESGCGIGVKSSDAEAAENATRHMYGIGSNALRTFGNNGLKYAKEKLSISSATEIIEKLFRD